jgi:hypothetical protein
MSEESSCALIAGDWGGGDKVRGDEAVRPPLCVAGAKGSAPRLSQKKKRSFWRRRKGRPQKR